jgi:hypothetical protein
MVAGEVRRGFFQELELHLLFPGFPLKFAQPRSFTVSGGSSPACSRR